MAYSDKVWKDSPDHTTPLSAAGLNDWEARIKAETDALSVLAASNAAALVPPLAPRLLATLNAGKANVCISVMTDSTGRNDTASGSPATGWVRRMADYLGALFPAYTVNYYDGAASGTYGLSYGSATVVQTGAGSPPVLSIYNAAIAGKTAGYFNGGRVKTAVRDLQPDLVLLSFGYNNLTDTTGQWWWPYLALAETVLYEAPCELGLIAQPPAVSPSSYTTEQQTRVADVLRMGRILGAPVIDVCQAFTDTGSVATYVNSSDGLHPNSLGQALWATTVNAALVKGGQSRPSVPAISGLHKVGSNLVKNGALKGTTTLQGWTLNNVTVSQDSTNFERTAQGYAAKLTHTATTGYGAYISQALDLAQCKGRWVTACARFYIPSGQTVDSGIGRLGISDGVATANNSIVLPDINQRDCWQTLVVSLKVDPSSAGVDARVYVDGDATSAGIGANVTVQDVVYVVGPEPRGLLAVGASVDSPVVLTASTTTETPLTVNAKASQSADVVQINDSTGALASRVQGSNGVWEFTKGFLALVYGLFTVGNGSAAVITRRTGDTATLGRCYIDSDGNINWNAAAAANSHDAKFGRLAADIVGTASGDKLVANAGLGVGNSAAATTPGTVVKKMEVFNASGTSLGYVPIYDAIT